ncbi:MAG: class I SAM-dependent methyltransferase [Rhodanobacteraceae bacterium]|nr:class I SAM-dependent methyltransferase [Rhodanobacteraceae bacterium]
MTGDQLQSDWSERQLELGNVPQAVLLRNLPSGVNGLLDQWHRALLRWSLAPLARAPETWIADLGCGYGRIASEAAHMGFSNVIGLDYEAGFCRQYQLDHGLAVRGSIAQPPFAADSLSAAYTITALMYVGLDEAAKGMETLDASLRPGARVLLLEAGSEFNRISRMVLRRKRMQSLAVSGFSHAELHGILPAGWRAIATGSNAAATLLLPLLLLTRRWPRVFDALSAVALRLDRPRPGLHDRGWRRFGLHRWVLCEKPISAS